MRPFPKAYINKHFIPLGLDTYFRGNSQEVEFCKRAESGGNRVVVTTAEGRSLVKGSTLARSPCRLLQIISP